MTSDTDISQSAPIYCVVNTFQNSADRTKRIVDCSSSVASVRQCSVCMRERSVYRLVSEMMTMGLSGLARGFGCESGDVMLRPAERLSTSPLVYVQ